MASGPDLGAIARRLAEIADLVAGEAETATSLVRTLGDEASRVAALAAGLEDAAASLERNVRRHAATVGAARDALRANMPVIEALEASASGVTAISMSIAQIAQESRILSLNARIEAARAGAAAFAVVATGMSTLAARTKDATDRINDRAATMERDVGAANAVAIAHAELVEEQDGLLASSLESAGRQRDTAAKLADITAQTAIAADRAAIAIGRVGASATAVKVLARQVVRGGDAGATGMRAPVTLSIGR